MGAFVADRRDMREHRQLQIHPRWIRRRTVFWNAVAQLRRAGDPADYLRWQLALVGHKLDAQREADLAAANKRELREQVRRAHNRSELRRLTEELDAADRDAYVARSVLALLRGLGDALVWAALSYRRGLITALGHGQRVDRLSTGKGLTAELEKLTALWDERQILAIHADLTSCLRAGDLLCIDPSGGAPSLLEVKASGRQACPRQADRLEFLQAIIDGRVSTLSAETPAAPVECDLGLKAHHDVLGDLLRRAESETYVWTQPERGLLITAVDESDPAGIGPSLDPHRAETVKTVGWVSLAGGTETEWRSSSTFRLLRDRRHSFPGQAPLCLLPLEIDLLTKLITGPLLYLVDVHLPTLVERARQRGLEIEFPDPEATGDVCMKVRRGPREITVPAPVRDQVLNELLSLESLIDILEWLVNERESAVSRTFGLDFSDERRIWTAGPFPGD